MQAAKIRDKKRVLFIGGLNYSVSTLSIRYSKGFGFHQKAVVERREAVRGSPERSPAGANESLNECRNARALIAHVLQTHDIAVRPPRRDARRSGCGLPSRNSRPAQPCRSTAIRGCSRSARLFEFQDPNGSHICNE